jgi:trehalose 6-phosphate phosphatase
VAGVRTPLEAAKVLAGAEQAETMATASAHSHHIGPPPLSADAALFLDFDGTLAEFALRPDRVDVSYRLPGLLLALRAHLQGAVAIISGRRLAEIDALLKPAILAGAGVHGAELRFFEGSDIRSPSVPEVHAVAHELCEHFAADPRVLVENKGAAVALHFRQAPERARECGEEMARLAGAAGLDVLQGNHVVEARAHGADKGAALRTLAAHVPFTGRMPVFVGDDRTDEDGFAAAAELGGYGVKVGPGETCARYRCSAVAEVHDWLRDSIHRME